jgi:hypothetical protein
LIIHCVDCSVAESLLSHFNTKRAFEIEIGDLFIFLIISNGSCQLVKKCRRSRLVEIFGDDPYEKKNRILYRTVSIGWVWFARKFLMRARDKQQQMAICFNLRPEVPWGQSTGGG